MKKARLFFENIIIYGLGSVLNKIIPIIMVPIITRLMPDTSYFGISDMTNTVISFCGAIAGMGMYDAMYRMFFEKDDTEYKLKICSTSFACNIVSSFVVFLLMLIFKGAIANAFFDNPGLSNLVYICAMATLIGATNNIISAPTRMQNKRRLFIIGNLLGSILAYAIAIPFLLKGYYLIALPLSQLISAIVVEVYYGLLNHSFFSFKWVDYSLIKPLLKIAIPLIPTSLIYWVFNSADKLMITNILGMGETGIYSIGAKLGHASQLIFVAFAGGWQYFSFSTMKEENQVESNSMIFEYLAAFSFCIATFVFSLSWVIYKAFFVGDYIQGFIVAPYLFMAPLVQILFQVSSNQFIIGKKSWPVTLLLTIGAILNVIINYVFIPLLGIEGASIATLAGYVGALTICLIVLVRLNKMVLKLRFYINALMMIAFVIVWRAFFTRNTFAALALSLIFCVINALLYSKEIKKVMQAVREKMMGDKN